MARAQAGALFYWPQYKMPCAISYDAVWAILRDRRFGREPPADQAGEKPGHQADFWAVENHSLLQLEPPKHTRLHGLILRAFTSRKIAGMAPEIAALIEEILRYDPPLHMFTRYVYEDVKIGRHTLRAGTQLACLLGAANRDPNRAVQTNTSFGAGVHFCIGAPLARLELQIALPILLARFPGLKIAEKPQYANTYHFHGLSGLPQIVDQIGNIVVDLISSIDSRAVTLNTRTSAISA